MPIIFKLD